MARLHVIDSSILFSATGIPSVTPGNPPLQGASRRMMLYADKAAFRTGYVSSTFWDKDIIGRYSLASGIDTKATGHASTAMGDSSEALGAIAFASGFRSKTNGNYSTAMGIVTTASGASSTAMGYYTNASGTNSTAMGSDTHASGASSTALGYYSFASGGVSTAMGGSIASGDYSTAMGVSTASGDYSTAMGGSTESGNYSTAMGRITQSFGYAGTVIGMNNNPLLFSAQTSVTNTTPLFIVGNGDNSLNLSNAMVVRKDGNVGIGSDVPKT